VLGWLLLVWDFIQGLGVLNIYYLLLYLILQM
jgi:hypothetical protein